MAAIDYNERSMEKEILDGNNIPFEDIACNMKELEWVNAHLGGHSINNRGFKKLLPSNRRVSICEIGCGGGDNLNALYDYCIKNKIEASFTGIDINKDCIGYAKQKSKIPGVSFMVSDYKKVTFNTKPDIIFSSLFCHHFNNHELVEMLLWMKQHSVVGFFINDLHRHPLAYHFIKMTTRLFSKSYLVKNDAPLSVLRGFKRKEWAMILDRAGIKDYEIEWRWAFRYLVNLRIG